MRLNSAGFGRGSSDRMNDVLAEGIVNGETAHEEQTDRNTIGTS